MELTLSQRDKDEIIHKVIVGVVQRLREEQRKNQLPDMVTTSEAARILGITPDRLRHIACSDPHRYPHTKRGDSKQSPLMWVRDALIN